MKNKSLHILLVEDDKYFRLAIKDILLKYGVTLEAGTVAEAQQILETQKIDLALIDIHLGADPEGLAALKAAKSKNVPSIILSSCEDDEITEKAYELGADHFLVKRHYRKHLEDYVQRIIKNLGGNQLREFFQKRFITQDKELIKRITELGSISLQDKTIFLSGETGVGKSLVGKLIHELNFKENAPFVHINCSEVPENLLEAELFGYKKGAFTGATQDKPGRLSQANGGILFLDEIGTMSMSMQQKLLKALDEKTFYPVGSSRMESSRFTLVSATCEDLFEKAHNKSFRKDLFFRISGLNLEIKPLRKRPRDIELLIRSLLKKSPRRIVIKAQAMDALTQYSWPGNTRELLKCCEILTLKSSGVIRLEDLPDHVAMNAKDSDLEQNSFLTHAQKEFIGANGLKEYVKLLEKRVVKEALENNQGKIAKTIKDLKLSSSAFYRVLESIR